ncbi:MAG: DEAD/DEAH box helicase [Dehalococcoidia bacterium]
MLTLPDRALATEPAAGEPTGTFGHLTLSAPIARALCEMGYTAPTPIQSEAIPPFLEGEDVVGRAKTGTGKTAAFGIPIAQKVDPRRPGVQALVLVPTRELARQVADDLTRIGWYRNLKVLAVYGGDPIHKQIAALEKGVHIVVGTPGRVIDHLSRGTISFRDVSTVILDECDEMLDIGFADDIETILRRTPKARQTGLFSATIPMFVRKLVWRYMKDPVSVEIDPGQPVVEQIDQVFYEVADRDKARALIEILDGMTGDERILIFRRTQRGVDSLTRDLWNKGFHIQALHGGLRQSERNRVMEDYRSGELPLLVATNVAARGIDVEGITHVFNFDMPDNVEEYIHRIGRTARAGRTGTAVSFVGEWDFSILEQIREKVGDRLRRGELRFYQQRALAG